MKIICFGYRDWALNIYESLSKDKKHKFIIFNKKKYLTYKNIAKINPSLILFYGWSTIIPKRIINEYRCLMLHPSKLPKFRGGSPLQNQIIRGLQSTYVTIFKMNNNIDEGNILINKRISLKGNMDEILFRIESVGIELTKIILSKNLKEKPQDNKKATYYKRLKNNSEITIDDLKNSKGVDLYNRIRMLGDPYPNAYIKTKDGKKLFIKIAKLK